MAWLAATMREHGTSNTRWRPAHARCWSASRRPLLRRLIVAAGFALAGCAGQQAADAAIAAPLPTYSTGDTYTFDDGRLERVVGTAAGSVQWRADGGFSFTTTDNVLLPRIAWKDSQARGERTMSVSRGALFPLVRGNNVAFRATRRTVEAPGGKATEIAESWQCRVDGTARVGTPAGDFDTFRVDCTVSTVPASNVLTRTFYYAPTIGYYVRREDRTGSGNPRTITLTGYTTAEPSLTPQAARSRDAARRTALETLASGQAQTWQDSASGSSGTVSPISTERSPKYGWCRTYQETVEANAHRYRVERIACRAGGTWQTMSS